MLNIKKRLSKIIILVVIIGILTGLNGGLNLTVNTNSVRAVGDLSVNWGVPVGQPFFSAMNMAPGDMIEKTVEIYNGASSARPVAIRGIEATLNSAFSDNLNILISRNGQDIYGGTGEGKKTLSQFFQDSLKTEGIELFTLNPGSSSVIYIRVSFDRSAGNELQNKNIVFDIAIGIAVKVPEECSGIIFSGMPIFGTESNDSIRGTKNNDLIFGFESNDSIDSGGGDDCVIAGMGNDSVNGGAGNDFIFGGAGNDSVDGGGGDDFIKTNSGNDTVNGNTGDDSIYGEEGSDTIEGGYGDDKIYGGTAKDILSGGEGNDTIDGNEGDDILSGGNGDDRLTGSDGKDMADGGKGTNICSAEMMIKCSKL